MTISENLHDVTQDTTRILDEINDRLTDDNARLSAKLTLYHAVLFRVVSLLCYLLEDLKNTPTSYSRDGIRIIRTIVSITHEIRQLTDITAKRIAEELPPRKA